MGPDRSRAARYCRADATLLPEFEPEGRPDRHSPPRLDGGEVEGHEDV